MLSIKKSYSNSMLTQYAPQVEPKEQQDLTESWDRAVKDSAQSFVGELLKFGCGGFSNQPTEQRVQSVAKIEEQKLTSSIASLRRSSLSAISEASNASKKQAAHEFIEEMFKKNYQLSQKVNSVWKKVEKKVSESWELSFTQTAHEYIEEIFTHIKEEVQKRP